MRWADTPRAVAEKSEIVFSIVTDANAVKDVALGAQGIVAGLRKGGVYIDMSTIAPDASRAVAAEFAKAGAIMLDAPISGSPVTLAQGNASIMVGGDAAAFERRQAGAARDRTEGVAHRRERSGLPDEDRGQPAAHGRGHRVRRGDSARRERRRGARRCGRTRSSRASPPRRCSAIAAHSSWRAKCRRCRSPT